MSIAVKNFDYNAYMLNFIFKYLFKILYHMQFFFFYDLLIMINDYSMFDGKLNDNYKLGEQKHDDVI